MKRATHRTSARHIGPHALLAHPGESAAEVRAEARRQGRSDWDLLCVVDERRRLLGTLTPSALLALPDETRLADVARRDLPCIAPGTDQEHMASLALHHRVAAMPVVDETGRLVGVVGPTTLMDILRSEHVEDIHHLAGIGREAQQARRALEAPPMRRLRHRLPWLLVGLAGSMLATFVVSRFEAALAAKPTIAFFVPALVYLADAIGTQSEAIAVRGLSLSRLSLRGLILGEWRTGLLIGLVLAAITFPMVWLAFGELRLALAVASSLASASIVAAVLGLMLPWLLSRVGSDPAYGSGPLATIVQDVLTLLIYFGSLSIVVF
ncbi:magnesium transporter [Aquabacterium sp. A7-Y]|uniref:magnesium transporter n=1 Tax=Aquabacterium sp. A7-Y TaxID=1349605 RepID=UPI00223E236C|nr:magnesium transporter [Aquabacterium sp. A7-Y]MCW7541141.1 magnesium transporter [Aquabacterium sp. A7-Y]